MRRQLRISVLLCAAFCAPAAMADPVDLTTYTINFTGSGLLPTAGSFTYDPDTYTFSSFLVVWDGLTFDLTNRANNPAESTPDPSCIGSLTGGAATWALLSGSCTPPASGFTTDWGADTTQSLFRFISFNEATPEVYIDVAASDAPTSGDFGANGQWTLTATTAAVPEPSSIPVTIALLSVALIARKRIVPGVSSGQQTNR